MRRDKGRTKVSELFERIVPSLKRSRSSSRSFLFPDLEAISVFKCVFSPVTMIVNGDGDKEARFANKKVEKDKRIVDADTEGRCDAENRRAMLLQAVYRGKENRNWKYANRNRLIDASSSLSGWREEGEGQRRIFDERSCVSTPFLVVPSRKTRRQGNRLIMRRCLYESVARACTFVKWRFTATFTLPLLYASRILSDASEFAFISNELGNLYRVEKRLTRWIIDEIFISTRERGKKERKKKKDFHLKG